MRQRSMKCSWEAARSVVVLPDHFVANSAGVKVLPMGDGVRVNVQVAAVIELLGGHLTPTDLTGRRLSWRTLGKHGIPNGPLPDGEPVSYIHLRAHQTKANLVCRL